jgi:MOSC domain-containing protein YiiM
MEIVSINVGLPREVSWRGKTVSTGIFKSPFEGPVKLRTLNLDGDGQADLSVHGGTNKAAYLYPAEHYVYWRGELSDMDLTWGNFGENFTTQGLLEEDIHIGDIFRVGSALVRVAEPRMPCYKLGIRFGRSDMVKRFLAAGRTGFYFAVVEEGTVQAGDKIVFVERSTHGISVADITRLYAFEKDDWATMRRAVKVEALDESWRGYFQKRLDKHDQGSQ